MKKQDVVIVMPFHKSVPNDYERISFINNTSQLTNYPIHLLLPKGADTKHFLNLVSNINITFFERKYFDTYPGSNLLWIDSKIYDYFREYKFILKCEFDAFVFRDELKKWLVYDYDYIGAPWIGGEQSKIFDYVTHSKYKVLKKLKCYLSRNILQKQMIVGNGGFSLRKVSTFRYLSKIIPFIMPEVRVNIPPEDLVWSFFVASYFPFFKIPDAELAMKFSNELEPKKCYELNGNVLPFGCHAWWKYDVEFWKPFIEDRGYDIN